MSNILENFKLTDKVAVVTGAARGLGQALALALAEAGAHVALVDLLSATETRQAIESLGRKSLELQVDLSVKTSHDRIVNAVTQQFGRIDILVNNAGIIRRAPLIEFSEKDWDEVIALNQKALFFL